MIHRSILALLILLVSLVPGTAALAHSYSDDLQTGWVYEENMEKYGFGEGFLHSHDAAWWYVSHMHAGFDYTNTELILGWKLQSAEIYNQDSNDGVYRPVWRDLSHNHFHEASWGAYIHEFWPVDRDGNVVFIQKGANFLYWQIEYHYQYACPAPGLPNKKCSAKTTQSPHSAPSWLVDKGL